MAEATPGVGRSACAAAQNSLQKTQLGVETAGIADKSESWMHHSSHFPVASQCPNDLVVSGYVPTTVKYCCFYQGKPEVEYRILEICDEANTGPCCSCS